MGFLSKLGEVVTGKTGIKHTESVANKSGVNDLLDDAGVNKIGTAESALDPLDFAGIGGKKKAEEASRLAEEAQLASLSEAGQEFRRATGQAQGFLEPFAGVGRQGLDLAGFLTDQGQQQDFLQNNALFNLGQQNLNEQTNQSAAARSRLSAGDTLEQLQQNATLAGQPLIQGQKQSIIDLLNFGSGTSRAQANAAIGEGSAVGGLIQDRGNVEAAGIAGRNQLSQDQASNNQQLALTIASAFSDPKLKANKKVIGKKNGLTLWSWDWNELAAELGLHGSSKGVMADEVLSKIPNAISYERGYMKVNYEMVGV